MGSSWTTALAVIHSLSMSSPDLDLYSIPIVRSSAQFNEFYRQCPPRRFDPSSKFVHAGTTDRILFVMESSRSGRTEHPRDTPSEIPIAKLALRTDIGSNPICGPLVNVVGKAIPLRRALGQDASEFIAAATRREGIETKESDHSGRRSSAIPGR